MHYQNVSLCVHVISSIMLAYITYHSYYMGIMLHDIVRNGKFSITVVYIYALIRKTL